MTDKNARSSTIESASRACAENSQSAKNKADEERGPIPPFEHIDAIAHVRHMGAPDRIYLALRKVVFDLAAANQRTAVLEAEIGSLREIPAGNLTGAVEYLESRAAGNDQDVGPGEAAAWDVVSAYERSAARITELEEAVAAFAGSDEAAKVEALVAERTRKFMIDALIADDAGKATSLCTWCGTPSERGSDEFKEHMMTCAQSPLVARVRELEAEIDGVYKPAGAQLRGLWSEAHDRAEKAEAREQHLRRLLQELRDEIESRFQAYGGGDRPSAPPSWLTKLAIKADSVLIRAGLGG